MFLSAVAAALLLAAALLPLCFLLSASCRCWPPRLCCCRLLSCSPLAVVLLPLLSLRVCAHSSFRPSLIVSYTGLFFRLGSRFLLLLFFAALAASLFCFLLAVFAGLAALPLLFQACSRCRCWLLRCGGRRRPSTGHSGAVTSQ